MSLKFTNAPVSATNGTFEVALDSGVLMEIETLQP
jgi:hypothetical protein